MGSVIVNNVDEIPEKEENRNAILQLASPELWKQRGMKDLFSPESFDVPWMKKKVESTDRGKLKNESFMMPSPGSISSMHHSTDQYPSDIDFLDDVGSRHSTPNTNIKEKSESGAFQASEMKVKEEVKSKHPLAITEEISSDSIPQKHEGDSMTMKTLVSNPATMFRPLSRGDDMSGMEGMLMETTATPIMSTNKKRPSLITNLNFAHPSSGFRGLAIENRMIYNPDRKCWEGNDEQLRDFESIGTLGTLRRMDLAGKGVGLLGMGGKDRSKLSNFVTRLDEDEEEKEGDSEIEKENTDNGEEEIEDYIRSLQTKPLKNTKNVVNKQTPLPKKSPEKDKIIKDLITSQSVQALPSPQKSILVKSEMAIPGKSANLILIKILEKLYPQASTWGTLNIVDVSGQLLEELEELDNFFPVLETLLLNHNAIKLLRGLPSTIHTIELASNKLIHPGFLSGLSTLTHINLRDNFLENVKALESLTNLVHLNLDDNYISDLTDLQNMKCLSWLSAKKNNVQSINFSWGLSSLKFLDLTSNKISYADGIEMISQLETLILDSNFIRRIKPSSIVRCLQTLSLQDNKLTSFDGHNFPYLKELFLQNNMIQMYNCTSSSSKKVLDISENNCLNLIHLSGNKLKTIDHLVLPPSLEALFINNCHLRKLSKTCFDQTARLYSIDAGRNRLSNTAPLIGIKSLKHLILYDNEIEQVSDVIPSIQGMTELVELDLRNNPLTSKFYPNMGIHYDSRVHGDLTLEQRLTIWRQADICFRKEINDVNLIRRMGYRSALLYMNATLTLLDFIEVMDVERSKAASVFTKISQNVESKRSRNSPDTTATHLLEIQNVGTDKDQGIINLTQPINIVSPSRVPRKRSKT